MKKVLSIFLILVYTASFSGMIYATDCQQGAGNKVFTQDIYSTCNKTNGHTNDNASHPLNQFCKLIEVHKEVLVSGPQKAFTNNTLARHNYSNIAIAAAVKHVQLDNYSYPVYPPRLFIRNRVLLI